MPIKRRVNVVRAPRAPRAPRRAAYMSPDRVDRRRERRADIKDSLAGFMTMTGLNQVLPTLTNAVAQAGTSLAVNKINKWGGSQGGSNNAVMTGLGAYKLRYNSIMRDMDPSQVQMDYVPQVANRGSKSSVRIRHREYLQDVQTTIGFNNLTYQINPANAACFPWLSAIAQNFQEYRFHGLVFHYVSLSSDALSSTNTALGAVIMSTDYNAGNNPYASKQAAENSEFTVSSRPSSSVIHGIECDPQVTINQGHLYVSSFNNGSIPTGQDIKTYNMGLFQFITQGSQAQATAGELWVSYDIELLKPIDNSQLNRSAGDHYLLTNISPAGPSNGYLFGQYSSFPFAPQQTQFGVGTTLSTVSGGASSTITFPANAIPGQQYLVVYAIQGSAVGSGGIVSPNVAYSNCVGNPIFQADVGSQFGSGVGNDTYYAYLIAVTIGPTATISDPATINMGSPYTIPFTAYGDLMIFQIPGQFTS